MEQAPDALVDAAEVARVLGVSRAVVYKRAAELGAVQVGGGPRPRLRFDAAKAVAAFERSKRSQVPEPPAPGVSRRRRKPAKGTTAPLLPIRGAEEPK